jgi:hypothetical protein
VSRRAGAVLLTAALVAGCHGAPAVSSGPLPRLPRDAARFEIESITDSTATFRLDEAQWIRPGYSSFAVDPLQRDALIAQLRIVSRDRVTATALVTSQVAGVKRTHVLLVLRPPVPWWKQRLFWSGAGLGAMAGAGLALLR